MKNCPLYKKLFTNMTISQKFGDFFIVCKKQLVVNIFNFHTEVIGNTC